MSNAFPSATTLSGIALHSGKHTSVTLLAEPGPMVLQQGERCVEIEQALVLRTDHGVTLGDALGTLRIDLVEHLFAAIGGLGVRDGLRVRVDGLELPLLDGGAGRYVQALRELGVRSGRARWQVARQAKLCSKDSVYEFSPEEGLTLRVELSFEHPAIAVTHGEWDGTAGDFASRIAPARTFGFLEDAEQLAAAGRARGVDLSSVIVLTKAGQVLTSPSPLADECARHKLLDLTGDLAIHGGLARGRLVAYRPGHSATHALLREAIELGVMIPA